LEPDVAKLPPEREAVRAGGPAEARRDEAVLHAVRLAAERDAQPEPAAHLEDAAALLSVHREAQHEAAWAERPRAAFDRAQPARQRMVRGRRWQIAE
jgi:hypothetical protein